MVGRESSSRPVLVVRPIGEGDDHDTGHRPRCVGGGKGAGAGGGG